MEVNSLKQKEVLGIILGGAIFIFGIPLLIILLSHFLDNYFNLPGFNFRLAVLFSPFLMITGLILVIWSVWCQFKRGKGSPVPLIPTQKLVITGPYKYCRNPMALGTVIYYLGIALFESSFSSLLLVALFSILFVLYIKLVEEKELEARFGKDYSEYKKKTPFIIPRIDKKGKLFKFRNDHNS